MKLHELAIGINTPFYKSSSSYDLVTGCPMIWWLNFPRVGTYG